MQLCLFEAFWARLSLSMDSGAENTYELLICRLILNLYLIEMVIVHGKLSMMCMRKWLLIEN